MLKYKYIFEIQHTEAILSNSTRKLLRFEITKMLIAVCEKNYRVIYYNLRDTFVRCCAFRYTAYCDSSRRTQEHYFCGHEYL